MNIYEAYDFSCHLIRRGELIEAAIYHTCQREIDYPHDAQQMLAHWHLWRVPPFNKKHYAGGYPRERVQ